MSQVKTYKRLEPVQKLAIVNARLRHGDLSNIAKSTESNPTTVRNVIEGKVENLRILNVAYDKVRQRKKNSEVIRTLELSNKKKSQTKEVPAKATTKVTAK